MSIPLRGHNCFYRWMDLGRGSLFKENQQIVQPWEKWQGQLLFVMNPECGRDYVSARTTE